MNRQATQYKVENGNYIGFANEYYTLWHIVNIGKLNPETGATHYEITYRYIQNLSKDLNIATNKAMFKGVKDLDVYPELRGQFSSYSKKYVVYPEDCMQFGKYEGEKILYIANNDPSYILWYWAKVENNTDTNPEFKLATEEALKASTEVKKYKGKWYTIENYKKAKDRVKSTKTATYFGEVGERHTEELILKDSKSWEGFYGRTYLITFQLGTANIVYMGGTNFAHGLEEGEKVTVSFTIKEHSEYNGLKQTKANRLKIK